MKKNHFILSLFTASIMISCGGSTTNNATAENTGPENDTLIAEKITTKSWDEHYDTVPFRSVDQPLEGSADIVGFKFKGKPINHLLLLEFIGFAVSDGFSAIREVDLTVGNESNRFYMNFDNLVTEKRGPYTYIFHNYKDTYGSDISLGYSYLGKLKNGVHLLIFLEDTGGTFVGIYVMGVRFHKEKLDYDDEPHVFMSCVKIEGITQNVKYKVDTANNRLQVIPVSNSPQADFADMDLSPYWIAF